MGKYRGCAGNSNLIMNIKGVRESPKISKRDSHSGLIVVAFCRASLGVKKSFNGSVQRITKLVKICMSVEEKTNSSKVFNML